LRAVAEGQLSRCLTGFPSTAAAAPCQRKIRIQLQLPLEFAQRAIETSGGKRCCVAQRVCASLLPVIPN
jgi:hypothetical protein